MTIEVNAQDVINSLVMQNQQLVAEITLLKITLGLETAQEKEADLDK